MANTRIKIRRTDLIDKLKQSKEAANKRFEKDSVTYEAAISKAVSKVRDNLSSIERLDDVALLAKIENRYNGHKSVDLGKLSLPSKPTQDTNGALDQMIRVLEASCDETISVAVGDAYARYL